MKVSLESFLLSHRDRVFTVEDAAKELGEPVGDVRSLLLDASGSTPQLHEVGNGSFIFSSEKDLVAYSIFKGVAPFITRDEWSVHKEDLPYLMYLSRRRGLGIHRMDAEAVKRMMEG